jgi:hypothetical protein
MTVGPRPAPFQMGPNPNFPAHMYGRRNLFHLELFPAYGLNPTLCHNSAVWYIVPPVTTYSTLRVL